MAVLLERRVAGLLRQAPEQMAKANMATDFHRSKEIDTTGCLVYHIAIFPISWKKYQMTEDQLDRIDRNIIAAMAKNGRLSMAELAEKVGLSKTPVQARLKRLEKDGYIRGYAAIVDREKMGEGHVAFVQVKLSDTRSAALDAFNRAVGGVAEIEQCHMMAASFDYLLKVRTRDIAAYRRVLGERISALPHVAQTSTFVAMETVKDR
jgi:Lrp/AsnC family leucine-responsive transcriptional regulator